MEKLVLTIIYTTLNGAGSTVATFRLGENDIVDDSGAITQSVNSGRIARLVMNIAAHCDMLRFCRVDIKQMAPSTPPSGFSARLTKGDESQMRVSHANVSVDRGIFDTREVYILLRRVINIYEIGHLVGLIEPPK